MLVSQTIFCDLTAEFEIKVVYLRSTVYFYKGVGQ